MLEYGLLAQLGERLGHNQDVIGSSPIQTTTEKAFDINAAGVLIKGF